MNRQEILPQFFGTQPKVTFDFDLASSETISSKTLVCTVYSGTDGSPSLITSAFTPSSSGSQVSQILDLLNASVPGVIYDLACEITTSTGQTLLKNAYLAVVSGQL